MVHQVRLFSVKTKERNRSVCSLCLGHKRLCGKPLCPILTKAETLMRLERRLSREKIFGSSPPAVFVDRVNRSIMPYAAGLHHQPDLVVEYHLFLVKIGDKDGMGNSKIHILFIATV